MYLRKNQSNLARRPEQTWYSIQMLNKCLYGHIDKTSYQGAPSPPYLSPSETGKDARFAQEPTAPNEAHK